MRTILIAGCAQEISSFNPVLCEYDFFDITRGDDIRHANPAGANSPIAGAMEMLSASAETEFVFTYEAEGIAAGPLRHSAFQRIASEFLDALKPHAGKIDGAYFSMHGSMGTPEELDPEGYLLAESRKILGNDIPIVISMDLHGVLTAKMLENVDGVAPLHTYPHVDFNDSGRRAANILHRILAEGAKPIAARVRIPAIVRGNELITETGLFGEQIRYAKSLEEDPRVLSAGFFICNPFTDVPELCSQPFVFTDGDEQLASEGALKMANDFWPNRSEMQGKFLSLEESVARAAKMKGPIAFTDAADAPSSGGSGESNAIIAEMVRQKFPLTVLSHITDAPVAAQAHKLGVGATFTASVGGKNDHHYEPLELEFTVNSLTTGTFHCEKWEYEADPGPSAVLTSGNITLVVTTNAVLQVDRASYLMHGLDPANFHSIVVKSPHCEPEFYDDWVEANFNVDAPGSTSANLPTLGHVHCARPMYPLEPDAEFTPQVEIFRRPG